MNTFALDALLPTVVPHPLANRVREAHPLPLPGRGLDGLLPGQVTSLRPTTGTGEDPETVREAGRMLESFFLTMLLKQMRSTVTALRDDDEGYFAPPRAEEIFTQQLDQVLGDELARANQLGLADVIVRQLLYEEGAA